MCSSIENLRMETKSGISSLLNNSLGSNLSETHRLTKTVDGISGATLSVNAIRKLAALALYFDREARSK